MTVIKPPQPKKRGPRKNGTRTYRCSICNREGHTKNRCPSRPKRKEVSAEELMLQGAIKPKKPEEVNGKIVHRCSWKFCNKFLDEELSYGPFCSHSCMIFHRRNTIENARSNYQPEFAKQILWEYVHYCEQSHLPKFQKVDEDNMVGIKGGMEVPNASGYAVYLGVSLITLRLWARQNVEFHQALLFLKQLSEHYLTNRGLSGQYDKSIATLLLMNYHNFAARSQRDVSHTFGIVKEVYEKADAFEAEQQASDPFLGLPDYETEEDKGV
jgi:hypothetical protein